MRVVLAGLGRVGLRVATELCRDPGLESLLAVHPDLDRAAELTEGLGPRVGLARSPLTSVPAGTDVVVLAAPLGAARGAAMALRAGCHVVAALDDPGEVRSLLGLGDVARAAGRTVVVGATMAPGLSCVLARWGARRLDVVEQVHVASFGTGGPTCARRHHNALSSPSTDWYDGQYRRRPGGSGRELVFFPEPVGGADCYRARLVDPVLLVPAFPGARRVTSRLAATRRDRLTSALPMLRRPHPEGTVGATRVELRGRRGRAYDSLVVGATGRPALVAATVAAAAARWAVAGRLASIGAGGLATLVDEPGAFLAEVAGRGITVSMFEGLSPGQQAAMATV